MFSEGVFCCKACDRSVAPVRVRAAVLTTWTGWALSSARTPVWRVPVTMTSLTSAPGAVEDPGGASCARAIWATDTNATVLTPQRSFLMDQPPHY